MRKSNLTYKQLIKIAPKDRHFIIEVESNPYGEGETQILLAKIDFEGYLNTYPKEGELFEIDNVNYGWADNWEDKYQGKFKLIDSQYLKPEVLEVGTKVQILESARDCGDYDEIWSRNKKNTVGTIGKIEKVIDNAEGLSYMINGWQYPSYCLMPVEEKRTIEDVLADLSDEDKEIIKSKLQ